MLHSYVLEMILWRKKETECVYLLFAVKIIF